MIIWGSKGITGDNGSGQFHCPRCAAERPYTQKRVRRFFTLYFIPLFPTSTEGEYVQCQACTGEFELSALVHDPEQASKEAEALFMRGVKALMIATSLSDGDASDAQKRMIHAEFNRLDAGGITASELQTQIDAAKGTTADPFGLIKHVLPDLNDLGKETVICSAYKVATADGTMTEPTKAFLKRIAAELEMTNAHVKGVLADLAEKTPPALG